MKSRAQTNPQEDQQDRQTFFTISFVKLKDRMSLAPDLRNRLETFLRRLPLLHDGVGCARASNALSGYRVWDFLRQGKDFVEVLCERATPEEFLLVLQALQKDLVDEPERLHEAAVLEAALRSQIARPRVAWKAEPPYLGLLHFDVQHAPIFFGRDQEVADLARAVATADRRFTVVAGASGSGKSSLVRAGLWARLRAGNIPELPDSDCWLISAMKPGDEDTPHASLRSGLRQGIENTPGFRHLGQIHRQLAPDTRLDEFAERLLVSAPANARWLLILDQMEELFSEKEKLGESYAFLDRLLEATKPKRDGSPSRFQVLATLRADFWHHCLDHEPLKRAMAAGHGTFPLSTPKGLALQRMVSGPVTELELPHTWILDPKLPPAMAADAEREPGGLALMAFALEKLFQRCGAPAFFLSLDAYHDMGGIRKAIADAADAALSDLDEEAAASFGRVFPLLARVNNRDDEATRRRAPLSTWEHGTPARRLVDAFIQARLLVTTFGEQPPAGAPDVRSWPTESRLQPRMAAPHKQAPATVEVAHEALLREWPKLKNWIADRRDAYLLADRVRSQAEEWRNGDEASRNKRPWDADVIDRYGKRLKDAGLLDDLLRDQELGKDIELLLTPELDWILAELENPGTSYKRRAEIGSRLADLGDPRSGVGVHKNKTPDILWCDIPAGEVELEGHGRFRVERFKMAAYPVTFSQFEAFLTEEDGFHSERHRVQWWEGLKHEAPDPYWATGSANYPVTDVSWYDATAFCRWLTVRLKAEGRLDQENEVRLPDEQEWQWATQSAEPSFEYPWGTKWEPEGERFPKCRANTFESNLRRMTAAGMFPDGRSGQGVLDLSGNLWEWCRNEHGNPRRTAVGGEESRVLRGGSWGYDPNYARAAYRYYDTPVFRNDIIGFRVVCWSPIPAGDWQAVR